MRILFDHDVPSPLRRYLANHTVDTAREKGWAELRNGYLLENTEAEGYDILITADQNLRYQQNIAQRTLSVVVLLSNRWPMVQLKIEEIRGAVEGIQPGEVREVLI